MAQYPPNFQPFDPNDPFKLDPSGYVDPNRMTPGLIAAQLMRAQFKDWQSLFQPIELQAMQQLSFNNPRILSEQIGEAQGAATNAYRTLEGTLERGNRGLGIIPTAPQAQASQRILNVNRNLAIAGAENQARANVRAEDEAILMGTAPNPNVVRPTS